MSCRWCQSVGVFDGLDADALLAQVMEDIEAFAEVASEPVEVGGDDGVAVAGVAQHLDEAGTVEGGAGLFVGVDPLGSDTGWARASWRSRSWCVVDTRA